MVKKHTVQSEELPPTKDEHLYQYILFQSDTLKDKPTYMQMLLIEHELYCLAKMLKQYKFPDDSRTIRKFKQLIKDEYFVTIH